MALANARRDHPTGIDHGRDAPCAQSLQYGCNWPIAEVHIEQGRIEDCTVLEKLAGLAHRGDRSHRHPLGLSE
jgi:hypothetical protein